MTALSDVAAEIGIRLSLNRILKPSPIEMRLLLYYKADKGVGKAVSKIIRPLLPPDRLEIFRTVESFSRRIRRFSLYDSIVLVVAADFGELKELSNMREILSDSRLILILPDREKRTVTCGHLFFPRFMSYADSDLTDIVAVLEKLVCDKNKTTH